MTPIDCRMFPTDGEMTLLTQKGKVSKREINERIARLLEQSIHSTGVINLFDSQDVGEQFSLFDPSVLEEIAKMKEIAERFNATFKKKQQAKAEGQ